MSEVTGPVSTLPGSIRMIRELPPPQCDSHPDRQAEFLIQGETDSMGAEWIHACDECRSNMQAFRLARIGTCAFCSSEDVYVRHYRDPDEGSCGPVYDVCAPCRDRRNEYYSDMS